MILNNDYLEIETKNLLYVWLFTSNLLRYIFINNVIRYELNIAFPFYLFQCVR